MALIWNAVAFLGALIVAQVIGAIGMLVTFPITAISVAVFSALLVKKGESIHGAQAVTAVIIAAVRFTCRAIAGIAAAIAGGAIAEWLGIKVSVFIFIVLS